MRLSERLGGLLGADRRAVGARTEFPVAGLTADRLAAKRTCWSARQRIFCRRSARRDSISASATPPLSPIVSPKRLARRGDPGGDDVLEAYIARAAARCHDAHARRRSHEPRVADLAAAFAGGAGHRAAWAEVAAAIAPRGHARRAFAADRAAEPDAPRLRLTLRLDALPPICHELVPLSRIDHCTPATRSAPRVAKSSEISLPARPALPARISGPALPDRAWCVWFRSTSAARISAKAWRLLARAQPPRINARSPISSAPFPRRRRRSASRSRVAAWENLGRVMVETMNIDRILKQPDRLHVTNGHWISRYKEQDGARADRHHAYGQLGARHVAGDARRRAAGRRLPPGEESLRRPLSPLASARSFIRAACSAAAGRPARTRRRRPRG